MLDSQVGKFMWKQDLDSPFILAGISGSTHEQILGCFDGNGVFQRTDRFGPFRLDSESKSILFTSYSGAVLSSFQYNGLRAERRVNIGGVDEYAFKARMDPFSRPLSAWFRSVDSHFEGFSAAIKADCLSVANDS